MLTVFLSMTCDYESQMYHRSVRTNSMSYTGSGLQDICFSPFQNSPFSHYNPLPTFSRKSHLQRFKPLQRHPRRPRHELQQPRPHLLRVRLDRPPEPLHDRSFGRAMLQPRVRPPVRYIDRPDPANQQLELPFVERSQKGGRHELCKALLEGEELLLDAAHEPVVDVQTNVLPLIVLRDWNGGAARFKFVHLDNAKAVVLDREGGVQDSVDVVFAKILQLV